MEETVIDQESTELVDTGIIESEITENEIDDLSEEEFAKHYEEMGTEPSEETQDEEVKPEDDEPIDLAVTYKNNLGTEAKLDNPVLIKVDGELMEIDSLDEIRNMMERGVGVTKRFQKLSEDRKALEEQIKELGQVPNVPEDDPKADEIESISNDILQSEYAKVFTTQIRTLPDDVKQSLATNPEMLKGLAIDYASGLGENIMPQVHRFMSLNGMSFEDAYMKAGKAYQSNTQTQDKPKVEMLKAEPKKTNSRVSNELGSKGIDNMSTAEFDKYFAEM